MQYTLNLPANTTIRQGTSGSYFVLMDTGAATSIDIAFRVHAQIAEHITTAKRGLKATLKGSDRFTGIEFLSTVACVVTFVISDGQVDLTSVDGANVNVSNAIAIPVSNDRGSPGLPVYVNGTISGNPTAVAIVDDTPIAVGATPTVPTALLAALSNRVSARFTNTGTNPVALGGAGVTWAKATVIVQPGDTWIEERAANLAWYGVCNTALPSTVGLQEVTA